MLCRQRKIWTTSGIRSSLSKIETDFRIVSRCRMNEVWKTRSKLVVCIRFFDMSRKETQQSIPLIFLRRRRLLLALVMNRKYDLLNTSSWKEDHVIVDLEDFFKSKLIRTHRKSLWNACEYVVCMRCQKNWDEDIYLWENRKWSITTDLSRWISSQNTHMEYDYY